MPRDMVSSVCPHDCPSVCALAVERLDARTIGRVHGAPDHPYTAGVICAKVARYAERQHHPDRLGRPLRRVGAKGTGAGAYVPIAWDDALDIVAARFLRAAERHGGAAVWPFFYAGTMGLVQRDGIERLRHVMGYSRQHSTYCNTLSDAGWRAGVGAKWGVDRARDRRIRSRRDVGRQPGRDPGQRHDLDQPRPQGARRAFRRHRSLPHADRGSCGHSPDAPTRYRWRARLRRDACPVQGGLCRSRLSRAATRREPTRSRRIFAPAILPGPPRSPAFRKPRSSPFARLYGRTKRSYIRIGYGFTRSRNGAAQLFAASCLPAVTGAWQYPGGGALYSNAGLFRLDRTLIEGLDRRDRSIRVLDQSRIGPILTGDRRDLGDGPPVTALLVQNTNPMAVAPESLKVREGLARDDLFVCVHEQFLTETAAMADIVLPATTFLEHDDIYIAAGHTFLQVARKVIEPHAEARSNHDVICGLAQRLGARHPGFAMTAWEMIDATLAKSGLPDAATIHAAGGHDMALPFAAAHFLTGFGQRDGRFHFRADWAEIGPDHHKLPALPDHVAAIEAADDAHPFRMIAPPARSFLNTSFNNTPSSTAREGGPAVRIHPADMAVLGLGDGARVRLGNRRGSVVLAARAFAGVQRGVVVVEGIWPNHAFAEGIGINALTSADPGLPNGGAVYHDSAVWVRPA